MSENPPDNSVVRRALSLLDCFGEGGPEQTVSGLAARTELPVATVHRLLGVLVDWGGVERVSRGRYRLGVKMWRLGAAVPQARGLRDAALPFLEDLYEATHTVVHLAIVDGDELLYVEKISGRRSPTVTSRVGRRLPLYATGPGKVLLAHDRDGVYDRVVAAGLAPLTSETVTDETALRRALAEIRRRGFAVSRGETSANTASVAAPIADASGTVVASVSVVTTPDKLEVAVLAPLVMTVGRAIGRALGAGSGTDGGRVTSRSTR